MNRIERIAACSVAAAVLGMAACTADKTMPQVQPMARTLTAMANPCATPPAAVVVNVNQVNASGATATINVSPDKALIPASGGSVRWMFNANGYRLAANAVTFKPSEPAGPASGSGNTKDYYWCFGSTAPGATWKYTISFSPDSDLTKVYDCDPTIINTAIPVTLQTVLPVPPVNCTLRP